MKSETAKRIRLAYGILLSLMLTIAGLCLMGACLGIYRSGGEQIFTPEKVAAAFSPIAVPVYLCLALILLGFLLEMMLPPAAGKRKAEKDPAATLARLLKKRDIENCNPELRHEIETLRKGRKRLNLVSLLILTVCSIAFLFYGANPANFHQSQINASMAKAMYVMIPCLAIPFGFALWAGRANRKSLLSEIELVKPIPVSETVATATPAGKGVSVTRWALVAVALALLLYGFFAGGTADVLTKAVNICTECVGLG